jgi:PAS domain S-box-containing protein
MKDQSKTKPLLIQELASLKQRIKEFEQSESERKRYEEALRRAEENFRRSLDDSPMGIRIVTIEGETIYANRAILDIYGYNSIDELKATPLKKRYTPKSYAEFQIRREKRNRGDYAPSEYEISIIRKDGEVRNLQVYRKEILWDCERQFQVTYQDITDRKRAEEALRKSEANYRQLFHDFRTGIYQVDFRTGKFLKANDAFCEYLGYSQKEITSLSPYDILTNESKHLFSERLNKMILGDKLPENPEFEIINKNGQRKWVQLITKYVYDSEGLAGADVVAHDITERKQTEKALRESEERYRYLVKHAPTGIFEVDFTTRKLLSANDAMCQYTGYTREEFLSMGPMQLLTEESLKSFMQRHARVLAGEAVPDNVEYQIKRKNGSEFWALLNTRHSYEPDNRIIATVIAHDITERKQVEDARRESEEKYRLIAENMADVISVLDMNLRFTYISPSIMRLRGFAVEEAMEQTLDQVMTPESLKIAFTAFEEEMKLETCGTPDPDRIRTMEVEEYRKDGSIIWVEISLSYLRDKNHKPVGILAATRDITERKRAEEENRSLQERLQRAEKMEALGTLAGGVAHDLNNVLGIVVGYAEMLLMDADESSPIREDLVNIMSGGQRAAAIVQDLLALARRGVSGRKVLNLNRIIADSQQSPEFNNLSSYHPSIKIRTDLEPGLLNISGSSVHLGKTVFNLVSNASEAMPNGGILTIKTANQYLEKPIQGYDDVREGDYVVLSVSDTGEGIAASDLKRIFEPFYTKKVMGRSGTGLGLAVVWGTVKDHNGYINVESEEGKGSIFTLYFPASREGLSAEAAAISISEYMGKGESILIVDDVKGQRDLAEGMLKKLNYNVSSVSTGEQAIAYLKEHKIDLIVLDMIMDPGMDGLDTYKKVLEIHPQQKAIIVSGFSETDRVSAAQKLGAGAYVRKPYVIEKLGLAVRNELDRK